VLLYKKTTKIKHFQILSAPKPPCTRKAKHKGKQIPAAVFQTVGKRSKICRTCYEADNTANQAKYHEITPPIGDVWQDDVIPQAEDVWPGDGLWSRDNLPALPDIHTQGGDVSLFNRNFIHWAQTVASGASSALGGLSIVAKPGRSSASAPMSIRVRSIYDISDADPASSKFFVDTDKRMGVAVRERLSGTHKIELDRVVFEKATELRFGDLS